MNMMDYVGLFVIFLVLVLCVYMYRRDDFKLKCIISGVDGNRYCVREREQLSAAADLLATVTTKCKELVSYVHKTFPQQENVQRLVANFNPRKITEIYPRATLRHIAKIREKKLRFVLL